MARTLSMQYTIRSVPEAVDLAVRHRASRENKSINAVVVEELARGLQLDAGTTEYTDLAHLVGTWQEARRSISPSPTSSASTARRGSEYRARHEHVQRFHTRPR